MWQSYRCYKFGIVLTRLEPVGGLTKIMYIIFVKPPTGPLCSVLVWTRRYVVHCADIYILFVNMDVPIHVHTYLKHPSISFLCSIYIFCLADCNFHN